MVNADHTRPLVAFALLASAAAVITSVGLQTNDSAAPIASPASATSSGSPEVVLGDVLRSRSDAVLTNPLSPGLWATASATPSAGTVQVASPSGPTTTQKARTETGGTHQTTTRAHATATTTTTSSPSTGHGKGRGKSSQPAKTTTATATTTDGKGKGRPADPGGGH
jgi:hypothetical protein